MDALIDIHSMSTLFTLAPKTKDCKLRLTIGSGGANGWLLGRAAGVRGDEQPTSSNSSYRLLGYRWWLYVVVKMEQSRGWGGGGGGVGGWGGYMLGIIAAWRAAM